MRTSPTRKKSIGLCAVRKKSTCPTKFNGERHLWDASQKRKIKICEEIESTLTVSDTSGRYPKGALKKMIDTSLVLNPWLTRDMIKNLLKKRKAKRNAATTAINFLEPFVIKENRFSAPNVVNTLPSRLEAIKHLQCRLKGTSHLRQHERKLKFEGMKDFIVLGWVDKAKRPNMKLQE